MLNPGDAFATGQIMRESVGIMQTLEAVKDIYKSAKYDGIGCGIKSTGIGNGVVESGNAKIRVLRRRPHRDPARATRKWGRAFSRDCARRCAKKRACRPRS